MTVKEFNESTPITKIDVVGDLIISVYDNDTPYGVDVDTSTLECGTQITTTEEFVIENDILTSGDIELNMLTTNML
jgi:hypothetical protein